MCPLLPPSLWTPMTPRVSGIKKGGKWDKVHPSGERGGRRRVPGAVCRGCVREGGEGEWSWEVTNDGAISCGAGGCLTPLTKVTLFQNVYSFPSLVGPFSSPSPPLPPSQHPSRDRRHSCWPVSDACGFSVCVCVCREKGAKKTAFLPSSL